MAPNDVELNNASVELIMTKRLHEGVDNGTKRLELTNDQLELTMTKRCRIK